MNSPMNRASKQWASSFLIKSFLSVELKESLLCGARQAYLLRDYARLKVIGKGLVNLSPRLEHIGRYYLALTKSRESREGHELVKTEFELLADSPIPFIRASGLNALAAGEIILNRATRSTQNMLIESSGLFQRNGDLLGFIHSQSQLSLLCSIDGNHSESLQILRGLQPIIEKIGSQHEVIKSDYYNSVSYELAQIGNHEAAKVFVNIPLNSPHLNAYPEWLETARGIHRQVKFRSLLYSMGQVQGQIVYKKKRSNVLQFRLRSKPPAAYPLVLKMPDGELHFCDYPINEIHQLENLARTVTASKGIEMK